MAEVNFSKSPEEVAYGLMLFWLKDNDAEYKKIKSDIDELLFLYAKVLKVVKSPVHFLDERRGAL
ncbi:MAG: hypothetical protein ABIA75_06195 [Candidatus Neomarinimicrobiota bacterium]